VPELDEPEPEPELEPEEPDFVPMFGHGPLPVEPDFGGAPDCWPGVVGAVGAVGVVVVDGALVVPVVPVAPVAPVVPAVLGAAAAPAMPAAAPPVASAPATIVAPSVFEMFIRAEPPAGGLEGFVAAEAIVQQAA
jgi:hypothetical protein